MGMVWVKQSSAETLSLLLQTTGVNPCQPVILKNGDVFRVHQRAGNRQGNSLAATRVKK